MNQRRRKSDNLKAKAAWYGIPTLIVSVLTALGLTWGGLQDMADIQSAEAAVEVHAELEGKIEKGLERIDGKLEKIYHVLIQGR